MATYIAKTGEGSDNNDGLKGVAIDVILASCNILFVCIIIIGGVSSSS